jgi:hypothetical protein
MEELKEKVRNYLRTGRRELADLIPKRKTYSADKGVRRAGADTKRQPGVSARQAKIHRKRAKRWFTANRVWFGDAEAEMISDKRILAAEHK